MRLRIAISLGLLVIICALGACQRNKLGMDLIDVIAKNPPLDQVTALLAREPNINIQERVGQSPLMWAALWNRRDIAELLLSQGANLEARDVTGQTALMWASLNGGLETVKLLIEKGAVVNNRDDLGWTALMWAAFNGNVEIVTYLIEKGADVNAKSFDDGWTPMLLAASYSRVPTVHLLLCRGAKATEDIAWAQARGHTTITSMINQAKAQPCP